MCIFFKFIKMLLIMGKNKYMKVFKKDFNVNKIVVNWYLLGLVFIVLMGYLLFVSDVYLIVFLRKKKLGKCV